MSNDEIAFKLWKLQPGLPIYKYREHAAAERALKERRAKEPQLFLFNIYHYESDAE